MTHRHGPYLVQGTVQSGRFRVPYRISGQHHGTPVVCVGGSFQDMASWQVVVDRLRDRFPVVVFDLPGCHLAQTESGPAASLDEQLEALRRVVESAAPSVPVNVVGMSWGSVVAACYAAKVGRRVHRLLLGSFALRVNPRLSALVEAGVSAIRSSEGSSPDWLTTGLGELLPLALRVRIRNRMHDPCGDHLPVFHELRTWIQGSTLVDRIDLSRIRAQTLTVVGGQDRLISMQDAILAPHRIPDSTVTLIPEAGHFLHHEQPGILSLYRRFLLHGQTSWGSRAVRESAPETVAQHRTLPRVRRINTPASS